MMKPESKGPLLLSIQFYIVWKALPDSITSCFFSTFDSHRDSPYFRQASYGTNFLINLQANQITTITPISSECLFSPSSRWKINWQSLLYFPTLSAPNTRLAPSSLARTNTTRRSNQIPIHKRMFCHCYFPFIKHLFLFSLHPNGWAYAKKKIHTNFPCTPPFVLLAWDSVLSKLMRNKKNLILSDAHSIALTLSHPISLRLQHKLPCSFGKLSWDYEMCSLTDNHHRHHQVLRVRHTVISVTITKTTATIWWNEISHLRKTIIPQSVTGRWQ